MKSKTLILMFVAIVCGLGASFMTSRFLAERNNKESEPERVTVLVAKQKIPLGTTIKEPEKWFVAKMFNKDQAPTKAIQSFEQLKDRAFNKPINAEHWVTEEDMIGKDGGLPDVMQKGTRAWSLKVTMDTQVAGFVMPQTRVDIIYVSKRNNDEYVAKTILQNILVLAVDTTPVKPDDKPALVASTVTVQVTPKQAEVLTLAASGGDLRLSLRPAGDDDVVETPGARQKDLLKSSNEKSEEAVAAGEGESSPSAALVAAPRVPDVTQPPMPEEKKPEPPPPPPPKVFVQTIHAGKEIIRTTFVDDSAPIEKQPPSGEPTDKPAPQPSPEKS
jgi:pilus assembly protein CpaB